MRMLALGGLAIAGVALVGVGVASVKMAGDWQQSMTRLVTSGGESASALSMVSSSLLSMAVEVGTSTTQMAQGMYYVESAGFHGAAGLEVLKFAAMGAKAENADLGVVANAVTSALNAYGLKADSAAMVTNVLVAATASGKMTMQDLAAAVSNVLPATAKFHISLIDTAAAIATMTMQGDDATSAATHLRQVILALESPAKAGAKALAEIGLTTQQVSDDMKKSLPDTIQTIIDDLGKKFPVGSTAYNDALKAIAGGNKQLLGLLELSGTSLQNFKNNVASMTAQVKAGGDGIAGWNLIQGNFNFAMDQAKAAVEGFMIKLGSGLLPILTPLVSNIAKAATSFTDWAMSGHAVSDMLSLTGKYAQVALPILLGLGAMILAVLVPAFISLAAGVIAATWPILAIGAVVAGLVALFLHFYQTNAGFKAVVDDIGKAFKQAGEWIGANFMPVVQKIGAFLQANVLPVLQQVGAFIAGVFQPVWKQLVDLWNSQLLPIFKQLMPALQQMTPLFQLLGVIIGGLVVVAIGILIGLISGLAKGISYMVEGLANVVTGIVRIFSGVAQVVGGFIQLIVDLVHGNFSGMLKDLDQIKTGILNIFSGLWQAVAGLFQAAWGLISGIVGGFIQGIISFFQGLFDRLVGHSIIPDMINGIINWFSQLPGRVGSFIVNMVSTVVGKLAGLLSSGLTWASNFVSGLFNALGKLAGQAGSAMQTAVSKILSVLGGAISSAAAAGLNIVVAIANGIISGIASAIGNAMNQVGNFIQSHLPHSPAKMGPLVGLDQAGANIPAEIAKGMARGAPALQTSLNMMLSPVIPSSLAFSGTIIPANVSNAGSQQPIVVQAGDLYIDGQRLTQAQLPYLMNAIRLATGAKF